MKKKSKLTNYKIKLKSKIMRNSSENIKILEKFYVFTPLFNRLSKYKFNFYLGFSPKLKFKIVASYNPCFKL